MVIDFGIIFPFLKKKIFWRLQKIRHFEFSSLSKIVTDLFQDKFPKKGVFKFSNVIPFWKALSLYFQDMKKFPWIYLVNLRKWPPKIG